MGRRKKTRLSTVVPDEGKNAELVKGEGTRKRDTIANTRKLRVRSIVNYSDRGDESGNENTKKNTNVEADNENISTKTASSTCKKILNAVENLSTTQIVKEENSDCTGKYIENCEETQNTKTLRKRKKIDYCSRGDKNEPKNKICKTTKIEYNSPSDTTEVLNDVENRNVTLSPFKGELFDDEEKCFNSCGEAQNYLNSEEIPMSTDTKESHLVEFEPNQETLTTSEANCDILKMLMENEPKPKIPELLCASDSNSDDDWEKVETPKKLTKNKLTSKHKISDTDNQWENVDIPVKLTKNEANKRRKPSHDSDFEIIPKAKKKKKADNQTTKAATPKSVTDDKENVKLEKPQKSELTEGEKEIQRFTNRCLKKRDCCLEQSALVVGVSFFCYIVRCSQSNIILGILLSLLPEKLLNLQRDDLQNVCQENVEITSLLAWYKETFVLSQNEKEDPNGFFNRFLIMKLVTARETNFEHVYVSVFRSILQVLGLDVRFVGSLYVPSAEKVAKNSKKALGDVNANPTFWLEVKSGDKLLAVDVVHGVIHEAEFDENFFSKPACYIVSITSEMAILDSTPKYFVKWSEIHRKARMLNFEFWDNFITNQPKHHLTLKEHFSFMKQIMVDRGFPKSLGGFKHNLVFALEKDNLKIEAIYPKDSPIIGTFKSHNIYNRENVKTLKQLIVIKKEGRQLRVAEIPYKIVKQKILYDRWPGDDRWKDLPLYGDWQTEWYIAPTAENGVVPRNEFGNVELFQPWMLPKGTKHLDLPGSYALARRLNIDAPHAVTGFEFPRCRAVPVMSGVVVCEQFAETLQNAWVEYSAIQTQKAEVRLVVVGDFA